MTSSVYLLAGERFLAEEALAKIRAEEETDPLSEIHLEGGSMEVGELTGALGTASLMGGKRLVVVSDAHELKKEGLEALERYIASPSPSSVLVLIASGRTKLETLVKQTGSVVTLDPPKGRRLIGWIRARAGEASLKLDERAAWALTEAVGTELRDLEAALQQLATAYGGGARIGAGEVKQLFSRLADERIYAFTDGVGDRRLPVAMMALRRLLDQGEQPLVVLGALSGQVRRMLRARRYVDQGPRAVADALGMPMWRAERLQRQARSYREEDLAAALQVLAVTDVEMKGGDLPPDAALEKAVIQIVTGSAPARMF